MSIDKQIDRIRSQQLIEDRGADEARQVFREAVRVFRKWLSPVRQAAEWSENVDKIKILCRLEEDDLADAELIAIRAAAALSPTIQPSIYDGLAEAAGIDRLVLSPMSVGAGETHRVRIHADHEGFEQIVANGGHVIVIGDCAVSIADALIAGRTVAVDKTAAAEAVDRLAVRDTGGSRNIQVQYEEASVFEGDLFDAVHDPWRPSRVYSAQLKAHPTKIVEPATLAATPYPPATYQPLLPKAAIDRGLISDAQFEAIVYALQATEQYLPGSVTGTRHDRAPRAGFIIGDGTGVGKTNEAIGIILDQWNRKSRRHIFVVEREKHHAHIQDAWTMLGGNDREIVWHGDYGARDALPDRDMVLVTSYALIRNPDRLQAILDWALERGRYDGCLIFDEAHNMRNAVEDAHGEGSGPKNVSQQGQSGLQIQNALLDARVVYLSATMATDVYNFGYAPRLGLWGVDAPFGSADSFIAQLHELDEAALEQICIDLKSAGRYCSRNLSFDGVEYDEIEHRLTPSQRMQFNQTVRSWRELQKIAKQSADLCGGLKGEGSTGGPTFANQKHRGASRMRRLMIEQMLAAFNTDSLIEDIHAQISEGNAPVVQIAFTGEALLNRIANGRTYVPDEDFFDKTIVNWVEETFPIHQMRTVNCKRVPVLDANGDPIEVVGAKELRDEAMALAHAMSQRHSPLDRLYLAFGPDMIAEMTGRGSRAVPVRKNGQLVGWEIEERSPHAAVDDVEAFADDRKQILVFSLGAGGTGLSYHAARDNRNRRRRVHYILELGQRAEQSVQGIGRTHRSGQVIAPIVKLVRSDVPAHAIYASRTLSKIAKMGALSRGHQQAATNAIFDQRVPLSGIYAQRGWLRTLQDIEENKLPGFTLRTLAADLEVSEKPREQGQSIQNFDHVILKLATLSDGDQRALVDRFTKNVEEAVAAAIRQGSYNQGMETIRGDSIELVDESNIVNSNGSATTYYRLRKKEEIELLPFRRAARTAAAARSKRDSRAVFLRHKVNGRIILAVIREGAVGVVDVFSPSGTTVRTRDMLQQEPWKIVDDIFEAERLWDLESETLDLTGVSDLHILSGALLYNWDKLPKTGIGLNRCRTDDGKVIVGRVIHSSDLRDTLSKLGMRSNYRPPQIAALLAKVVQGAEIHLNNGWRIAAPTSAGGDYLLLIPDDQQTGSQRKELMKAGISVIDTPLGYDLEIPRTDAIDIIQRLAIGSELTLTGTTMQQTAIPATAAAMVAAPLPLAAMKA